MEIGCFGGLAISKIGGSRGSVRKCERVSEPKGGGVFWVRACCAVEIIDELRGAGRFLMGRGYVAGGKICYFSKPCLPAGNLSISTRGSY